MNALQSRIVKNSNLLNVISGDEMKAKNILCFVLPCFIALSIDLVEAAQVDEPHSFRIVHAFHNDSNDSKFEDSDNLIGLTSQSLSSYQSTRFTHPLQTKVEYTFQGYSNPILKNQAFTKPALDYSKLTPWYELHKHAQKGRISGWKDGNTIYKFSLSFLS